VTAAAPAPGRSGLLEQLMALVRPEFRTDIYIPASDDPVFVAEECAVAGCDRTAASIRRRLCNAHAIRFRKRGRPPMEEFLADPGPPVRGRRPLAPCVVESCRYGRNARNGLCARHRDRWNRAGRPDLASWKAPDLAPADAGPAECRLPFCSLWAENPAKIFCAGHDDRWQRHGRPDPGRFVAECELVGTACIDLQDLAPQLKLEIQYALQCRADARSRTAAPRMVSPAVRHAKAVGVTSLLDLTEQQWRHSAGSQVGESALFLLDARDALESLRDGAGWEIEYPKDVWRLHKLPGITIPAGRPCPHARLRFDRIAQPWLRELAKRWTRLRLASGLSIGAARGGVDALTCFSRFLALTGVNALAGVDRPLLERYLAHVASLPGGPGMKKTRIGALNLFFQNIRQHGWDDTLPGTAAFYQGDIPAVPGQVDRRLAEYVMAQVEAPANLDRWPSPAGRLITLILTCCGLRISSALALGFDCLLHDGQGDSRLRSAMDLACTCDRPRVYLAGDPGSQRGTHAQRPWRRRITRGRSLGCVSRDPSTCAFPADVTLCIAIGRGLAGRPVAMINYVRTDEQTWSNHGPETVIDQGKENSKNPSSGRVRSSHLGLTCGDARFWRWCPRVKRASSTGLWAGLPGSAGRAGPAVPAGVGVGDGLAEGF
jgi:hypothetical protein